MISDYIHFLKNLVSNQTYEDLTNRTHIVQDELGELSSSSPEFPNAESTAAPESATIEDLIIGYSSRYQEDISLEVTTDGSNVSFSGSIRVGFDAALAGTFTTSDGRQVSFAATVHVEVGLDVQFSFGREEIAPPAPAQADPLALDLDGDNDISLTPYQHGATFDINGDGILDQTAFVQGQDVFLGLDRNNNGFIDNGRELFGDQHGAASGYLELAKYDDDQNGVIDQSDSIYQQLLGVRLGQQGLLETYSLQALGVKSINLSAQNLGRVGQGGNVLSEVSTYESANGTGTSFDVLLNYSPLNRTA